MANKLNCGVFWDIENVAVPQVWDAAGIVSTIRSSIIEPNNWEERDFYVACGNVNQISMTVGKSLESMRVNVIQPFFDQTANAADKKIVLLISKFIKNWGDQKCAIVVVTGDSDFLDPLLKLKLNNDLIVYLVHGRNSFSPKLLWCADVSYQLDGGTLRETSLRTNYSDRSGFIKFSGLYEDSESHNRVHQINNTCAQVKPNSRVLRISKGTVWIGYTDQRQSMTEFDLRLFAGIRFIGCIPQLELVNFLWPDNRYKNKSGNQLAIRVPHSQSKSDHHIRSTSAPSNRNNQTSIGVKVSTGPRRQSNKPQSKTTGNDVNISVSLRVTGPATAVNSTPRNNFTNRRDKQLTNQKTDKNDTTIRLPRVSSS